jgi:hypothetical protein
MRCFGKKSEAFMSAVCNEVAVGTTSQQANEVLSVETFLLERDTVHTTHATEKSPCSEDNELSSTLRLQ